MGVATRDLHAPSPRPSPPGEGRGEGLRHQHEPTIQRSRDTTLTSGSAHRRLWLLLLGSILGVAAPGCAGEGDELLVASTWPEAERDELAIAFRRWAEAHPGTAAGPVRVRWVALQPGD